MANRKHLPVRQAVVIFVAYRKHLPLRRPVSLFPARSHLPLRHKRPTTRALRFPPSGTDVFRRTLATISRVRRRKQLPLRHPTHESTRLVTTHLVALAT